MTDRVTEPLLLGVKDAAALAGCARDFMYKAVAEGRIRSIAVGGRKRLIPRAELERWIERELADEEAP